MGRIGLLAAVLVAALAGAPNASAWSGPLPLPGLDGTAAVAVDADGLAAIAAGGTVPRVAQRLPYGSFGPPLPVAELAPGPPRNADVAAAGHGALAVAWQDGFARIMAAVRDPGAAVGAPQRLSLADGRGVTGPQVAVDARGGALAAWLGALGRGGRGLVYAAYRPPGGTFGAPVRLTPSAATYPPAVAMNAGGRAVVTWRRATRTEAVAVDRGRFGRVAVIGRARRDGRPAVAVAGDGAAVIAWSEGNRTIAAWRARHGDFGRPRILRASRPRWTAGAPAVAAGPSGETVVAWREGYGARRQIVAVRGRRRSPETVRPFGAGHPGTIAVAVRPGGGVTVAWERPHGRATPALLTATARRHGRFGAPRAIAPPWPARVPVLGVAPALASGGRATVLVWTIPSDGVAPAQVLWAAVDDGRPAG